MKPMLGVLQIFGLHGWEWLIIFFVVLLLFGANKIPEIARSLGRALGEFQKARAEVERELRAGIQEGAAPAAGRVSTPQAPPLTATAGERERLLAAAKALGIQVREEASVEELREALRAAVKPDNPQAGQ
jgi:sec-independent protein translocase protein TatA